MAATNSALLTDTDELHRTRTRDVYQRRKQRMLDKLRQDSSQQVLVYRQSLTVTLRHNIDFFQVSQYQHANLARSFCVSCGTKESRSNLPF